MRDLDPRRDWGEGELDLALEHQGCPICLLGREAEEAVLSWLAKVNIRDAATIARVVGSRGLCDAHWRALADRTDRRSERAFDRLLQNVAAQVQQDLGVGNGVASSCPVCAARDRRERGAILQILDRLDDPTERAAFETSFGLCQPHVLGAGRISSDPGRIRGLVAIQRSQVARLVAGAEPVEPRAEERRRRLAEKLAGARRP
jgi:hypothetical protein